VAIKWPNDLVAGGRKLGGVLTEISTAEETIRYVIAGIGVNLNSQLEDFPPDVRAIATSLRALTGPAIDRAEFIARLLHHFEARYDQLQRDGFAPLAPVWERYSCLTDRAIVVQTQAERIEGIALGLASDGTLRVRDRDGNERRVVAGDVTVVGGYDHGVTNETG
jgi:BirA family biotin operon repressor/biotin-[acetyl-CoA-carboxylase] ligase